MRKHLLLTLATMVTLVATAGLLRAIAGPTVRRPASPDVQFMLAAAESGRAEVELSLLAQKKAASARVKAAAQRIETDRQTANAELEVLAGARNLQLPTDGAEGHASAIATLDTMSGAAFDRAWAEQMIKEHEAAIDLFSKQSTSGGDAEVRAFAAKQLPALRAHLKQSQALLETRAGGGARR